MSAETKLPWFKFEPQVWLSDRDVLKLTQAQRGIYIDLLSHDWISRGLPANPADAHLLLTGGAKVKDVAVVLALFKQKLDGNLVTHKRSESQRVAFEAKSGAARASANARWNDANAMRAHEKRTCETDANASGEQCEKFDDAMPSHPPSRARVRAKETDKETEEEVLTLKTDSTPSVSAEPPKSVSSGKTVSRPVSEEEAVKLCRAQMIDAPVDFIHQLFNHLVSVDWSNGTGTAEITNFGAYVRKAWIQQKDERARRDTGRRPEPIVRRQVNGKVSTGIDYGKEGGK